MCYHKNSPVENSFLVTNYAKNKIQQNDFLNVQKSNIAKENILQLGKRGRKRTNNIKDVSYSFKIPNMMCIFWSAPAEWPDIHFSWLTTSRHRLENSFKESSRNLTRAGKWVLTGVVFPMKRITDMPCQRFLFSDYFFWSFLLWIISDIHKN